LKVKLKSWFHIQLFDGLRIRFHGGVLLPETRRLLLEFDTDEVGRLAREKPNEKKALIKAFTDSSDIVRERALIAM